jgi:hypothetical protein
MIVQNTKRQKGEGTMKRFFLFVFLFLSGCAGVQTAPQEHAMTISKIIEVPGSTKEQIFKKANNWVEKNWRLYSSNVDSGVIIGSGEVGYLSAPVDRLDYTFVFQMRHEIQDNNDTVTFEKIMLKSPKDYSADYSTENAYTGGEESPITSKKDSEAAQDVFHHISDNLTDFLRR